MEKGWDTIKYLTNMYFENTEKFEGLTKEEKAAFDKETEKVFKSAKYKIKELTDSKQLGTWTYDAGVLVTEEDKLNAYKKNGVYKAYSESDIED